MSVNVTETLGMDRVINLVHGKESLQIPESVRGPFISNLEELAQKKMG